MELDESPVTLVATEEVVTRSVLRPSRPLVAGSLGVIAVSMLLTSYGIAALISTAADSDWLTIPSCLVVVLLPVTVGVLQYAACFRQSLKASRSLVRLHFFGIYGFLLWCVLAAVATGPDAPWAPVVAVFLFLLVILAGWNVWSLACWSKQLDASRLVDPEDLFLSSSFRLPSFWASWSLWPWLRDSPCG